MNRIILLSEHYQKYGLRLFLLAMSILTFFSAIAHDFDADGIYYNIIGSNKVIVTYRGNSENEYKNEYSGHVIIPPFVTKNGVTYTVTSIGDMAFCNCSGLTSIVIPNTVTSIGEASFQACSHLTSVTTPNSLTSIGERAFCLCSSLSEIAISDSVTSIGMWAFNQTAWYKKQPDGVVYAGLVAYSYKGTMPAGTSLSLKDGTRGIASYAFFLSDLTSVNIPNTVTTIGGYAFANTSLSDISIPNSVVNIGDNAFTSTPWYNNQPDGVVYAGLVAYSFKGTMLAGTSLSLKDGTCGIASKAFFNCSNLASVTIPSSVSVIGNHAFYNCSGLTCMVIPDSINNISRRAFGGCTNLNELTIGSSVSFIEDFAFSGCNSIKKIICIPTNPPGMLSDSCFTATAYQSARLIVPGNSENDYRVAPFWNNFNQIEIVIESLTLNKSNMSLCVGDTEQLVAEIYPNNSTNKSLTWSSSNTSVATVSSSGVVTAKSTGTAVITAKTADGSNLSASCNVTVKQLATSISLNKTSETLYMGNTLQLIATVYPSTTSDKSVSWSSSNTAVATVSSDGLVTPKSTGTATITVRTEDGSYLTAQCVVTVKQYATSITLSETDISINTGNTFQLSATVLPSTTSNPSVTWSSSNTSVATVSSTGLVTAKSTGEAVITAKTADGSNLSASCNVTVKRLATSISLNKTSATLYLDQTVQLTATVYPSNATDRSVVWSSSDNSVATVSSTGLVTAIMPGTATITATTADGSDLSATCEITVNAYVTSLTLDPSEVTILEGDTITLTPTILPGYATNQSLNWSSSNTSIVSVHNGVVAGRSGGEATVTVRTADGSNLSATCKVTVVPNFDITMPNLSHIRGSSNNRFDLTIDLANRYDITGMQFDMQLPDGVTIAEDGYGEYDIVLDDARKTRNHTATANSLGNNTYRILVSSATANALKGHYGTVLHIMVKVPVYHVSGNKQVKYTNIVLSEPDETRHTLPTKYSQISYYYKEGDANADVSVDVADYVITGNYILQNGPENFWYDAANVDHNSTVDVNDLTGITNIALGRREGGNLQMPAIRSSKEDEYVELTANPLVIQAGQTKTLNLSLDGIHDFAGFQMDIQLPEGLKLVDASLVAENSGLSIATAELADGSIRLLASSFSLKDLAVSNNAFLALTLTAESNFNGNDAITLENIKFSERSMALHAIDKVVVSVGNESSGLGQVYSVIRIYTNGTNIIIDSPESGTAHITTVSGITQPCDIQPGHNVIPMEDSGIYIVTFNGQTTKLRLN